MDAGAIKAADQKVRETVEGILADIEARGEADPGTRAPLRVCIKIDT
jgi:hypothetical protein